ncbi:MAG TPA: glutathione S-transferase N-terminal domain-containing protein [Burkholderiaceae bacterium]|nr:glutathione S-transferase N-terminal domain-containing protein [Burkholderiaceae bacterium]
MLDVLGRTTSINVRKVLWTCAEIGIDIKHVEWGLDGLPLTSPEFLALNPNALVPVVIDDGFMLRESNTICRYLAAKHRRLDLLPEAAAARARVEQWMDWQATELNNAYRYAFLALVRRSTQHADAAAVEASARSWNEHMATLDAELQDGRPFVTGADFTLADIVLGLSTHRWVSTPIERPALPAVARYYDALRSRPAFQAVTHPHPP